jgi:integrase
MAYAEKRGKGPKPWRVKYRLPGGLEASESGFETKASALAWGRDQEARIREGRWTDPSAGKITVGEWIGRWLATQDVGISTEDSREYLIRRFIRPAWGASELGSLSTEEITKWENTLPAREGISRRTARDTRSLLCTILGDAAATKPPLIPYNPALRPRNRGRRTGRRLARTPQRVWATPLQVLLIAERAALLTGRADDFTMIITIAYTGLRWGEAIGLETKHTHPGEIHIEWQLRELRSAFHRLPPKDDSYRSPAWEPCLPVDLPPFLADLLARQVQGQPRNPCACAIQHGGTGRYVFLGPDGGHYRRSNYARRVFRPACDGRFEPAPSRPARLVIADATVWPGIPVAMWPPAQLGTTRYAPPRGRGIQPIPESTPLACWLPIKLGLTPHGLRHSHKTWMAEDGIPEILAEQRLGHEVPGMRGLYAHASDRMRDDLRAALQARWDESLRERAAIHPHSPVPLLDELLAPHRETAHRKQPPTRRVTRHHNPAPGGREKMISQIPPNQPESPVRTTRARPSERASDLVRHENRGVELRGFEPLTPSMRMRICCSNGFEPISPFRVKCQVECQMTVSDRVAQ